MLVNATDNMSMYSKRKDILLCSPHHHEVQTSKKNYNIY